MSEAKLDVIVKAINLMEYTMTITSNRKRYPVKHLTLVKRIQNRCMDIYEYLLDANRLKLDTSKSERQELQTKAISCCDKLSCYVELSMKLKLVALDGIHQIKRRLETKTYQVSKYNEFTIYEPKERVIKACSFIDKIVQHSLCDNVLIPRLSKEFIQTNCAGQIGKGTLFGLDCLKAHMYLTYCKYGYDCWIVKADISKFFYNIDHNVLKDIVEYFIEDKDVYWLCEKFIDSTEGVGLPLGNQVSQVYALLYLSGLDHFITGELGVKYYGRYMDDFYLIVQDKEYAKWCLSTIYEFVYTLGLELNGKTQIIPFKNGIKFCGFHTYVTPDGKVIRKLKNENRRATKKKFKKMVGLVKRGKLSKEKFYESYNAWKNHISHGNCVKLVYEMDRYVEELFEN